MQISSTSQVFQTNSSGRWKRFQWTGRILAVLLLLGVTVIGVTLSQTWIPDLPHFLSSSKRQALASSDAGRAGKKTRTLKQTDEFDSPSKGHQPYRVVGPLVGNRFSEQIKASKTVSESSFNSFRKFNAGIRAAFYVNWNKDAFVSLQQNIAHLNMVMPEWFFIDPAADTLQSDIDKKALDVMVKSGVKIIPLLTNNDKGIFRSDVLHRVLNDRRKKERLISDILKALAKNNLDGINIDFEELKEVKNETLVGFQRELCEKLHAKGYLVTQDVEPFNHDYNLSELSKYNDYVFLMAYDQHSESTAPGPVAPQKWVETALDRAARQVPAEKLILSIAGYGYDWRLNGSGKPDSAVSISYLDALMLARSYQGDVVFDNDSYNLHFEYADDKGRDHAVHFTDASTTFNSMRFAADYGVSGVALWRLGSEDSRIWDFYDRDMSREIISRQFDFSLFNTVKLLNDNQTIAYPGEGEILDVIGGPTSGKITHEIDTANMLISEENYVNLPSQEWVARKYGTHDKKKLVLSFDDGPDPTYTPQILDILSREKVPATFFLVGINAENNIPIVKRIYREGHEIGNHTFTHPNIAKVSRSRAVLEMKATRSLIECITGHSTIMFRAPFNADFEPEKIDELEPVAIAREYNYLDIGESIDPTDWKPGISADSIVARVIRGKENMTRQDLSGNIILLHDAGGRDRAATVAALPRIIHYFKQNGYTFTTVADLLGVKKDELMPPVDKGAGYFLLQINYYLAIFGAWASKFFSSLFIIFIVLSVARIVFLGIVAVKQFRKEKRLIQKPFWLADASAAPLVSIIVPAYNEEVNAVSALNHLLKTDYANFEIIFVDDGSKDSTFERVNDAFSENLRVKVYQKRNGGKASALNFGIAQSNAEYVVCIDADTKLLPDAVSKLMTHFHFPNVGAVAGNVKVGNQVNVLTRWQAIEYISAQNFERKAFAWLNAITVVPGAIGAFKKQALEEAGGFSTDTFAEDCDVTIRILRNGYTIANEPKAIAMTESPETLKMFNKQRFRWCFGVMQTFWKNRRFLFSRKHKSLGWIALPNMLIFQYFIPFFIPLIDFLMFIGLVTGNTKKMGAYYLVFMLVDVAVAFLAFSFEKENKWKLLWVIPQRLIWRWLMWIVLFRSFRSAIKGELQHWGVLKRTGNVKDISVLQPQAPGKIAWLSRNAIPLVTQR
jgi:peptidoglycan-N-acetylglucosamine deacetylase